MVLFVDDNEGVLFVRKIQVEVDPTPPDQKRGGFGGNIYIYEQKVLENEEELLILCKIFTNVCL